ncbi:hypothetical protein BVRB_3g048500 [Beta vulgaris subsp. vulgaris]|nr:hypothetical protein BVRB_3g048500 [Beta vulgaris subsp. vulgaris]
MIDISPAIRFYKTGRVERHPRLNTPAVPPSLDPKTGVESKDIKISIETNVFVRLFKPNNQKKLPILLYFHGGGFCLESTFSPKYHNYLNSLASKAQVMIVSVEYRRAPEHRLPAAYHDCWDALNWVIFHATDDTHNNTHTKELWLQDNVDFSKVFLMGDSSGGNIAHYLALRVGIEGLSRGRAFHINGVILVHPYFWSKRRIGDEASKRSYLSVRGLAEKIWELARPEKSSGIDDPWINPANDQCLSSLGCNRVLICVAQKDLFRDRGLYYKEVLEKSGWQGTVEVVESKGEDHTFHLLNRSCANSLELLRKVVAFIYPARCTL